MRRYIIYAVVALLTFTIGLFFASIYILSAHQPLTQISGLLPSQQPAESNVAQPWLADVFHDFDFVGSSPVTYKYVRRFKQSFILSEPGTLCETKDPRSFPQQLATGRRYLFRNRSVNVDDPFYRILENRFNSFGVETNVFIPHSIMSIVTDPPIPVRFIDEPRIVLQPVALLFHGKGYEGLVIRDEFEQTSIDRNPGIKSAAHDYSLIIMKAAQ